MSHLIPLKDNEHVEIDGKHFLVNFPDIANKQKYVPLYFSRTAVARIYDDSPVIGAYEIGGQRDIKISGPFKTPEEAEAKIEERKQTTEHVSYEFSGKVIRKAFPEEDLKAGRIQFLRYYITSWHTPSRVLDLRAMKECIYKERLEKFIEREFNPIVERLKGQALKFDEKPIDERFFNGLEIRTVTEDKNGKSFNILAFNKIDANYGRIYPGVDPSNQHDLDRYFFPSLTLHSISDYQREGNEILLPQPIDFPEAFDSNIKDIESLLVANKDKILIR